MVEGGFAKMIALTSVRLFSNRQIATKNNVRVSFDQVAQQIMSGHSSVGIIYGEKKVLSQLKLVSTNYSFNHEVRRMYLFMH